MPRAKLARAMLESRRSVIAASIRCASFGVSLLVCPVHAATNVRRVRDIPQDDGSGQLNEWSVDFLHRSRDDVAMSNCRPHDTRTP